MILPTFSDSINIIINSAAQDVAMVLYDEGSASEANFNTELVLASVLKSVDIAALTHDNFWG